MGVNTSIGVGRHRDYVHVMNTKHQVLLVGLRALLQDRFPGYTRHISVLKIDIEGAEYDALRDAYQMCADGELTIDELLVEVHVGKAIKSGARHHYSLHDLHAIFTNATA